MECIIETKASAILQFVQRLRGSLQWSDLDDRIQVHNGGPGNAEEDSSIETFFEIAYSLA